MFCPIDQTELLMSNRNGIEIDYCPECRGVWLDRGELDKIIERSMIYDTAPEQRALPAPDIASDIGPNEAATVPAEEPRRRSQSLLGEIFRFD